jgi:hypothetical protein
MTNFEGFSSFLFEDVRGEDAVVKDMKEYEFAEEGLANHSLKVLYSLNL